MSWVFVDRRKPVILNFRLGVTPTAQVVSYRSDLFPKDVLSTATAPAASSFAAVKVACSLLPGAFLHDTGGTVDPSPRYNNRRPVNPSVGSGSRLVDCLPVTQHYIVSIPLPLFCFPPDFLVR